MWLSILALFADITSRAANFAPRSEQELIHAVLQGSQKAASELVRKHWGGMMRVATYWVGSESIASEVVQEAWEAVFRSLRDFRGDSTLSTWIFRILVNKARRIGKRESRSVSFSELGGRNGAESQIRFEEEFTARGHWQSPVHGWRMYDPQQDAINREGIEYLSRWLEDLPRNQRLVITMRDVQGLKSEEICEILDISASNQRQLLHRARTYLRRMLEKEEANTGPPFKKTKNGAPAARKTR